jgi:hypothetical protein
VHFMRNVLQKLPKLDPQSTPYPGAGSRTLRAWKAQLLAFHRHRITSSYAEHIPTKIELIQRLTSVSPTTLSMCPNRTAGPRPLIFPSRSSRT